MKQNHYAMFNNVMFMALLCSLITLFSSEALAVPKIEMLYGPQQGEEVNQGESVFFTFNASCVGADCNGAVQGSGSLILVAAGDSDESSNKSWAATENIVKNIYNGFTSLGFSNEDICLIMDKPDIDIDGNGVNDQVVDHSDMTKSSVVSKISSFANSHYSTGESLYIWFVGHAGEYSTENTVRFTLSLKNNQHLTALDLQNVLTRFQTDTGCNSVVIFIESCFAGLFRPKLVNTGRRVIITATEEDYLLLAKDKSFSSEIMSNLIKLESLGDAFVKARAAMKNQFGGRQVPTIDANGDGKALPNEERAVQNLYIGGLAGKLYQPPEIVSHTQGRLVTDAEVQNGVELNLMPS